MLKNLLIKNYALIEELNTSFDPGLTILTGETGAGKSIIIDALSLALGERADSSAVRKGSDKTVVEASFDGSDDARIADLLARHEIDFSGDLILRREVSTKGQSRSFINDTPVPIAVLKEAGDALVDLHGQHEHQSLLRSETHGDMLDDFGNLGKLVSEFSGAYTSARSTLDALRDLRTRQNEVLERRSLYEFQAREIDAVDPHPGEEDELENTLSKLENAEKLSTATQQLHSLLYTGESAVHDQLATACKELKTLAAIDTSFSELSAEASSAAAMIDELAKSIADYNSRIEFNPEKLEKTRDRLGNLALLKKKYGGSLDSVISHREKLRNELELADGFEKEQSSLQERLARYRESASKISRKLSGLRHEAAKKMSAPIAATLGQLGIPHAVFKTDISSRPAPDPDSWIVKEGRDPLDCTSKGVDRIEFFVSTNPGEDPKPLAKVASGGEISRIMLALKMNLARSDRLPLMIFDEIDIGVSGRVAQAVGRSMKELSEFHQVIAITHLPQIAGAGDSHFVVEKVRTGDRSLTRMRKLPAEDRVNEVAKLMSGANITESARKNARELMGLDKS